MEDILQKTYLFNEYFQNSNIDEISYDDICRILCEIFDSNVYLIDTQGMVLGNKAYIKLECNEEIRKKLKEFKISDSLNKKLLSTSKIKININNHSNSSCIFRIDKVCTIKQKYSVIVPIVAGGKRIATVLLNKFYKGFYENDLILFEYVSTIVGLYIYRERLFEKNQAIRRNVSIEKAFDSLSKTEYKAIRYIMDKIKEDEGIIIVSEVAKNAEITRSIIVNALKKIESAGLIEERSLGNKGTHIKIINKDLKNKFKS